jgi:phosphatidate cytidylyltransferase
MPDFPRTQTAEPAGIKPRSFFERVWVAALYGIAVLVALWFGPVSTGVLLGIMAGFAAAEFYALGRREARLPNELFGVLAAAAMPLVAAVWGLSGLGFAVTVLVAASLVWHTAVRRAMTADTAITVFGALYTGFLLAYLVLLLRDFDQGRLLAYVLVFSVWANDVFAYLVGSTVGRHKMAPAISPKKSWEGFAAGSLATVAIWVAATFVPGVAITLGQALATGAAVAIAAVIGDLTESRMKREAGVKDSGTILRGHGGFLDRLDSLIFVCLVAYWVLWWGGVR